MAEIRVNATGAVKLYDNDDSNFVGLQAGSISSDVTFTLPTADGSNGQVLTTNGSGALSFATASSADPTSADGDSLGTASAEWSDLYLADGGIIYFGNDQDVTLTHDPDDGLFLKSIATGDDNPVLLTLQTGETDLAADDVIGKIAFQAPDESTGTDAILVSAAIQAVAEGDHSSSSNASSLQFMTGASEAAATKMTLSSAGLLTVTGGITMTGTTPTLTIGDAGAEDAKIVFDGNAQDYHIGLDDSLDSFVIGNNGFSTQCIVINDSAMVTMPNQPAFLAKSAAQSNLATATTHDIQFSSEVFDQNGDYNTSTYTFTAPVTGRYQLSCQLKISNIDKDSDYYSANIECSNTGITIFAVKTPYLFSEDTNYHVWGASVLVDMDASDTAKVTFRPQAGAAQADINANESLFSGFLAC
jgi:hypothetical protein